MSSEAEVATVARDVLHLLRVKHSSSCVVIGKSKLAEINYQHAYYAHAADSPRC